MESFELRDADAALLEQIAALAEIIWHEHYESILGVDQVNYMVEHFQSLPAMKAQIANQGYRYRGVFHQGQLCGYVATALNPEYLFLSKLYLAADARGLGWRQRYWRFSKKKQKREAVGFSLPSTASTQIPLRFIRNGASSHCGKKKRRLAAVILWTIISWSWIGR